MVVFTFPVLPDLKNNGVEPLSHPADRPVLCREIRALAKLSRSAYIVNRALGRTGTSR